MAAYDRDTTPVLVGPTVPEDQHFEELALTSYEPHGGDDLIPPTEVSRPADGELGSGD